MFINNITITLKNKEDSVIINLPNGCKISVGINNFIISNNDNERGFNINKNATVEEFELE